MIAFQSLRWKLVGSYLLLVAAVLLATVILTRYSVSTIFAAYQEAVLVRDGQSVARFVGRQYDATHDWRRVAPIFNTSTQFERNTIWIVDAQGTPVLEQPPNVPAKDRPMPGALRPALNGSVNTGTDNSLIGNPGQVWAAVPIKTAAGSVVGAVYIIGRPDNVPFGRFDMAFPFRLLQTTADLVTNIEQRLALTGVAVGVLAIGFGVWLARSITDPLQELRRAVSRIAAGDLTQRVRVRSQDEVGALACDINRMAGRLEADLSELRRQQALRRDLVANVSHDLATPLTGIQGFTEALLDGVVTGEEQRVEIYQSIYREVQRLRRLVGDLQDLSSLENGMRQMQRQPLHLDALVEEALKVERSEADTRGVRLHQEIPADIPPVLADGDRITQVLLNLLDNALRFTPSGGSVTVSARQVGPAVETTIADTGSGIPAEALPQIFERFYRVDPARTGESGGGGLGLAIVKAIITAHGGQIEAFSAPGEGTQMRFTLPAIRDAPADIRTGRSEPYQVPGAATPVGVE